MSDTVQTGTLIPYLTEMFRFQAWMALGKVASPVSGKVERDLNVAKQMIDLLGELETRTEGNRSPDENKILQGVLTELRLNYMDEMKKPEEKSEEKSAEKPAEKPEEKPAETPDAEAASEADDAGAGNPETPGNGQETETIEEESKPS